MRPPCAALQVFSAMEEQLGSQGTIQCRMTLQNVIDQAIEDMEHGIADMVDASVAQVSVAGKTT